MCIFNSEVVIIWSESGYLLFTCFFSAGSPHNILSYSCLLSPLPYDIKSDSAQTTTFHSRLTADSSSWHWSWLDFLSFILHSILGDNSNFQCVWQRIQIRVFKSSFQMHGCAGCQSPVYNLSGAYTCVRGILIISWKLC